ncbi:MAG: tetratricopeptide repeat protein [Leptospira sp.]|nr:tetratricopeptide repeat protein [Leptospira sp.]NCS94456.1 tetratricopeptide repeat protein [Leptospira sp.]
MQIYNTKILWTVIIFISIPNIYGKIFAESFFNPGGEIVKEGIDSFKNQEYKQSLDTFQRAEEELGNDPRLEFNKGTSIAKSGDPLRAIPHFEKALDSQDSSLRSKSYFNMGKAYESAQDKKKAIESYRKAIQEDPNYAAAKKNLELLYNPSQNKNQPQASKDSNSNSEKSDNSQNPFSPNNKSNTQSQKNDDPKNQSKENEESGEAQNSPNALSKEEAERLMESLNADRIQRKNSKTITPFRRDKFW